MLPGLGHGCGCHDDAGCYATSEDRHACCPASQGPATAAACGLADHGRDCPICKFYAQAKVAVVPVSLDGTPRVSADVVVASPSLCPAQRLRLYNPRGPPATGDLA